MRVMRFVVLAAVVACFSSIAVAENKEDAIDCIEACYRVEDQCIEKCASADNVPQCEDACVAENEKCQQACPES